MKVESLMQEAKTLKIDLVVPSLEILKQQHLVLHLHQRKISSEFDLYQDNFEACSL